MRDVFPNQKHPSIPFRLPLPLQNGRANAKNINSQFSILNTQYSVLSISKTSKPAA